MSVFLFSFFISAFTFMGGVMSYNDTTFGLLSMVAENWLSICLGFIFFISFEKRNLFLHEAFTLLKHILDVLCGKQENGRSIRH